MPSVNIFYTTYEAHEALKGITQEIRAFIAEKLSCGERTLQSEEISLRGFLANDLGMISSVEVEITAHAYPARIEQQDKICSDIAEFLERKNPIFAAPHVWLLLCELGHSWKD